VITLSIKAVLLFVAQAAVAWFFYRCRATSHFAWTNSDFVVFGVPLLAGFVAFVFVLFRSAFRNTPSSKRALFIFCISAICSLIASFVGAVVGFNLYGTKLGVTKSILKISGNTIKNANTWMRQSRRHM
jgi:hypothetical protein